MLVIIQFWSHPFTRKAGTGSAIDGLGPSTSEKCITQRRHRVAPLNPTIRPDDDIRKDKELDVGTLDVYRGTQTFVSRRIKVQVLIARGARVEQSTSEAHRLVPNDKNVNDTQSSRSGRRHLDALHQVRPRNRKLLRG